MFYDYETYEYEYDTQNTFQSVFCIRDLNINPVLVLDSYLLVHFRHNLDFVPSMLSPHLVFVYC